MRGVRGVREGGNIMPYVSCFYLLHCLCINVRHIFRQGTWLQGYCVFESYPKCLASSVLGGQVHSLLPGGAWSFLARSLNTALFCTQ